MTLIAIAAVRGTQPAHRPMRAIARAMAAAPGAAPPAPAGVAPAPPMTLIEPFWPTPEPDPERRDRAARQDAAQILHDLGRVQIAMLGGRLDLDGLRRIDTLASRLAPADPELGELCRAISARARIELARAECAAGVRHG